MQEQEQMGSPDPNLGDLSVTRGFSWGKRIGWRCKLCRVKLIQGGPNKTEGLKITVSFLFLIFMNFFLFLKIINSCKFFTTKYEI